MKLGISKRSVCLAIVLAMLAMLMMPLVTQAQTRRKPRLRRSVARRTTPVGRTTTAVGPLVPGGTNLKIRIEDTLSSKDSRVGDRFTATALDPVRFNEARITGHISSIQKSGKIQGRTSMNLAFDTITLGDRTGTLHGYVTRVYGSDTGRADNEGGVESASRKNQTIKRGAIGAGAGAVLGAIVGGGKGAAIGLILGGAGGAGSLAGARRK